MVAAKRKGCRRLLKECLRARMISKISLLQIVKVRHGLARGINIKRKTQKALIVKKVIQENINQNKDDLFDRLPDDILYKIVSCLNSRDAIRTGVLSRRWKDLWREASLKELYFEARRMPNYKIRKLVRQFNTFLESRSGSEIESLRMSCFLTESFYWKNIRVWSRFVLKNKVQNLDLNFSLVAPVRFRQLPPYPCFYEGEPAIKHLSLSSTTIFFYYCAEGLFRSLLSLTLKHCHVARGEIHRILLNCVSLEWLSIEDCFGFRSFDFEYEDPVAPFRLKHLSILNCKDLKKVDLRKAECLLSLDYKGDVLDELLCGSTGATVRRVSWNVSNCDPKLLHSLANAFPNLETLSLHQCSTNGSESLPVFPNLKNFQLVLVHEHPENLWPQICKILKASPSLHKLELHFPMQYEKNQQIETTSSSLQDYRHANLREVAAYNFQGQSTEVELLMHVVDCANSIEKIDIHKQLYEDQRTCSSFKLTETQISKMLRRRLPATINLQVFGQFF